MKEKELSQETRGGTFGQKTVTSSSSASSGELNFKPLNNLTMNVAN